MSTATPTQDPFILHPKHPASAGVRTLHGALTLAAWILYAYLWLPVVTVIAWLLGVRNTYVELAIRNYNFDQNTFGNLFMLAVAATVILIGWAEYNRHKFSGHDRRTPVTNVGVDDVGNALNADQATCRSLANCKSITLAMGDDARPMGVHRHTPMSGLL